MGQKYEKKTNKSIQAYGNKECVMVIAHAISA